jgi:hypothetical protein
MAGILERGPHQFRALIRRSGANICRIFETRREAEEWARSSEGKVTANEPVRK